MFRKFLFIHLCLIGFLLCPVFSKDNLEQGNRQLFGEDWASKEPLALGENPALLDYLRFGVLNNKELRHIYHHWKIGLQNAKVEGSLEDPKLMASQDRGERVYEFSQMFPFWGKRDARREFASWEAEEKFLETLKLRLQLERDIRKAYYDYAFLKQETGITEDTLKLLQQMEPVVQRKIQGGENQNDLLRLQVEIGRVENTLQTKQRERQAMSAQFNALLGMGYETLLPWPEDFKVETLVWEVETLKQKIRERNPDLLTVKVHLVKSKAEQNLAHLEQWPDWELGWMRTEDRVMGESMDGVKVGMTLPIWGDKNSARLQKADFSMKGNEVELTGMETMFFADLQMILYQMDDASRQTVLYEKTLLPKAEQALQITQASYRSGGATLLEVIDSERMLLDFEMTLWEARKNYEESLADLAFLCGGDVK